MEFTAFPKIPRLTRTCIVTEKIDGTNASIYIGEAGEFLTASRTRWITPENDNYGFASWAQANKNELLHLGPGHHFGEWWGAGIQRRYGMAEKRFSLFNTHRWADPLIRPACVSVVPVLAIFEFSSGLVERCLAELTKDGSKAAPGYMLPEGVVIYHTASKQLFKKTLEKDEQGKESHAS